jgi:hypothetical protein
MESPRKRARAGSTLAAGDASLDGAPFGSAAEELAATQQRLAQQTARVAHLEAELDSLRGGIGCVLRGARCAAASAAPGARPRRRSRAAAVSGHGFLGATPRLWRVSSGSAMRPAPHTSWTTRRGLLQPRQRPLRSR